MAARSPTSEQKNATLEPALGELGEVALDRVQPGAGSWHEVEDEAQMSAEPGEHLWVLVGAIVVQDDMHQLAHRGLAFDPVE